MNQPLLSKAELAKFFNVPIANIQKQYEENLQQLTQMRDKALATGKRVNQYTLAELNQIVDRYQWIVNN